MFKFQSNLTNRIACAKTLGFIFGLIGFFSLPFFTTEADLMFRLGILFWYTTLGGLIGLFGIMDKHPIFINWKFPFWFRGIFLGAWMNFMLILFTYEQFATMMQSAGYGELSPYWVILEGAILGLIIEFFATRSGGEGKDLIQKNIIKKY